MSKRLFSLLAVVLIVFSCTVSAACAAEYPAAQVVKSETVFLPDGSYIVTTIVEENAHMSAFAATQTISGSKTNAAYSAAGNFLFSITVHGTFSYDGRSAKAESASYSYSCGSSSWSFVSGSAFCSGATATATGTFTSALETKTLSVSLTCSANGTLS